jgi:hypothetical protein
MAYIGNSIQTQGFTPAIDYFNGNGVTVTFTLSRPVASVAQMIVAIDNVIQNPSSSFTVSGNAITFSSAPLSGTNNIWVEYTSLITTYQGISQDPTVIGDIRATGGYLAEGDFGNSYVDGTIVDYVTGNARITTGPLDDMTFYHGGTSGRSEMMKLSYAGTSSYIVGNLGIGTTSPNSGNKLTTSTSSDATSGIYIENTSTGVSATAGIRYKNSGSTVAYAGLNGASRTSYVTLGANVMVAGYTDSTAGATIFVDAAGPITFATNSAERMRINSSGDVGIGTSSPTNTAGYTTCQVTGANGGRVILEATNTGGQKYGIISGVDAILRIYDYTADTTRLTMNSSGIFAMSAYGAGAATFSASGVISSVSDETWKIKDGVPVNPDAMLQKLEAGYWFYNDEKTPIFGKDRQLGFYAQNVHEAIGEEAAPTPEKGKPWGYYDRSVLAVTVMSLKNALSTIEELKQRIAVLENK